MLLLLILRDYENGWLRLKSQNATARIFGSASEYTSYLIRSGGCFTKEQIQASVRYPSPWYSDHG